MGNKQKTPEAPPKLDSNPSKNVQKSSNAPEPKLAPEVNPNRETGYFNRPDSIKSINLAGKHMQSAIPELNFNQKFPNPEENKPVKYYPENEYFNSTTIRNSDHPLGSPQYFNTCGPNTNKIIPKPQEITAVNPNKVIKANNPPATIPKIYASPIDSIYNSTPIQKSVITVTKPQEVIQPKLNLDKTENINKPIPNRTISEQPKSIYLIPKTNNIPSPTEAKPIASPNLQNLGLIKQENPLIIKGTTLNQNQVTTVNSSLQIKKTDENETNIVIKKPLIQYGSESRNCKHLNCKNSNNLLICQVENCKKMFCNEMNQNGKSHVLYHINVTGHNSFGVISNLGYLFEIRCVDCDCASIFHLGFLTLIKKVTCRRDLYLTHNIMNEKVFFPLLTENKIFEIVHLIFVDSQSPNFPKILEICQATLEAEKFQVKA